MAADMNAMPIESSALAIKRPRPRAASFSSSSSSPMPVTPAPALTRCSSMRMAFFLVVGVYIGVYVLCYGIDAADTTSATPSSFVVVVAAAAAAEEAVCPRRRWTNEVSWATPASDGRPYRSVTVRDGLARHELVIVAAEHSSNDTIALLVFVQDASLKQPIYREVHVATSWRTHAVLRGWKCAFDEADDVESDWPPASVARPDFQRQGFMAVLRCPAPPTFFDNAAGGDDLTTRDFVLTLRRDIDGAMETAVLPALRVTRRLACLPLVALCTSPWFLDDDTDARGDAEATAEAIRRQVAEQRDWLLYHFHLGVGRAHVYIRDAALFRAWRDGLARAREQQQQLPSSSTSWADRVRLTYFPSPLADPVSKYGQQFLAHQHCLMTNRHDGWHLTADTDEYVHAGSALLAQSACPEGDEDARRACRRRLHHDLLLRTVVEAQAADNSTAVLTIGNVYYACRDDVADSAAAAAVPTAAAANETHDDVVASPTHAYRWRSRRAQAGLGKSLVRPDRVRWAGVHEPLELRGGLALNATTRRVLDAEQSLRLNHYRFHCAGRRTRFAFTNPWTTRPADWTPDADHDWWVAGGQRQEDDYS